MKRLHWEIIFSIAFVFIGTIIAYHFLADFYAFWDAQSFWSLILLICWCVVASGYWRQGSIIHKAKSATHVSLALPCAVFIVQCILFVKGIYYHDNALVLGALIVNSAVVFDIYQIMRFRK